MLALVLVGLVLGVQVLVLMLNPRKLVFLMLRNGQAGVPVESEKGWNQESNNGNESGMVSLVGIGSESKGNGQEVG